VDHLAVKQKVHDFEKKSTSAIKRRYEGKTNIERIPDRHTHQQTFECEER
jgi:hypothetical protein